MEEKRTELRKVFRKNRDGVRSYWHNPDGWRRVRSPFSKVQWPRYHWMLFHFWRAVRQSATWTGSFHYGPMPHGIGDDGSCELPDQTGAPPVPATRGSRPVSNRHLSVSVPEMILSCLAMISYANLIISRLI